MLARHAATTPIPPHDVCVVGAGPVGLAVALGCARRGLAVLLLEAGDEAPRGAPADAWRGPDSEPTRHARADVASCRALGGTSHWWGGRCVPLDAIDFDVRPQVADAHWPIAHDDLAHWHDEAAAFLGLGRAGFEAAHVDAATAADADLRFVDLERWTPERDIARVHRAELEATPNLIVLMQATLCAIDFDDTGTRVAGIVVADAQGARSRVAASRLVLACGGIETTHLLLEAQRRHDGASALRGLPIGRPYMGHMSGKIATLVLADPARAAEHDFFLDGAVYVRRRLTLSRAAQAREGLLNIAFWADNPPFHDAGHRSALLSLVWLALAIRPIGRRLLSEGVRLSHLGPGPHRAAPHLRNVLAAPLALLRDLAGVVRARWLSRPRKPGFLLHNRAGRYALHFHAEQSPSEGSITLDDAPGPDGEGHVRVQLRFEHRDAERIVRAHEVLDAALRRCGLGRLDYRQPGREARIDDVLAMASDGYHQIGGARMGRGGDGSVVDRDAQVHGVANLHVASSAVFCSAGQANPTFTAVALALRLAAHLDHLRHERAEAPANAPGACTCLI